MNGDEILIGGTQVGAAYLFSRTSGTWMQSFYIKAPNAEANDGFGSRVAFTELDTQLLIGAPGEAGGIGGVDGDWTNNAAPYAGAVYNFF